MANVPRTGDGRAFRSAVSALTKAAMAKNPPIAGAYRITCLPADKSYIGRSVNVLQRWANHRWALARGSHRNGPLQRAWREHGPEAFSFSIERVIEGLEGDALDAALGAAEVDLLRLQPRNFNLMVAGEPALSASPETRARLSAERKTRWQDPAYRERLSASHRARHADPEFSERRAAAISRGKSTPEASAKTTAQNAEMWAPGGALRETQGPLRRALWQDPAYRARQTESRIAAWEKRKRPRG